MPIVMQVVVAVSCLAALAVAVLYVLCEPFAAKVRQFLLELQDKEARMIRIRKEQEAMEDRAREEAWQELGGRPKSSLPRKDDR